MNKKSAQNRPEPGRLIRCKGVPHIGHEKEWVGEFRQPEGRSINVFFRRSRNGTMNEDRFSWAATREWEYVDAAKAIAPEPALAEAVEA